MIIGYDNKETTDNAPLISSEGPEDVSMVMNIWRTRPHTYTLQGIPPGSLVSTPVFQNHNVREEIFLKAAGLVFAAGSFLGQVLVHAPNTTGWRQFKNIVNDVSSLGVFM